MAEAIEPNNDGNDEPGYEPGWCLRVTWDDGDATTHPLAEILPDIVHTEGDSAISVRVLKEWRRMKRLYEYIRLKHEAGCFSTRIHGQTWRPDEDVLRVLLNARQNTALTVDFVQKTFKRKFSLRYHPDKLSGEPERVRATALMVYEAGRHLVTAHAHFHE